jgi:hypothetical protein
MDRERVFYPAVAMAVASYYLAFAVADGRSEVWLSELSIAAVFIAGAVLGFKRNPWIALLALGGHGVMDAFHHLLVHNAGVPGAWPDSCGCARAPRSDWVFNERGGHAHAGCHSLELR